MYYVFMHDQNPLENGLLTLTHGLTEISTKTTSPSFFYSNSRLAVFSFFFLGAIPTGIFFFENGA